MDARITKEVSDAIAENNRRRAAVAAGTVRVRYLAARCPSPDLPATAATGSVGDGAGGRNLLSSGWTRCSRSQRSADPRPRQDRVPAGLRARSGPAVKQSLTAHAGGVSSSSDFVDVRDPSPYAGPPYSGGSGPRTVRELV
ncbi:MAG: lysis protein [Burkholderiales bacterium]|nr:lysis protein [Burkholderiales bacterium]